MEGLTTREIAKAVHISLKDIGTIIRKYTGEEDEYQNKSPSVTSKAFQMFKDGKSRVEVAIDLNLEKDDVVTLYEDYLDLINLDRLMSIYRDLGNDIYFLYYLFHQLKQEGIVSKGTISRFTEMARRLTKLDEEELKLCEQIGGLNSKKFELEKEIEGLVQELASYITLSQKY